jgi:hypothetical protein
MEPLINGWVNIKYKYKVTKKKYQFHKGKKLGHYSIKNNENNINENTIYYIENNIEKTTKLKNKQFIYFFENIKNLLFLLKEYIIYIKKLDNNTNIKKIELHMNNGIVEILIDELIIKKNEIINNIIFDEIKLN